MRRPVELGSMQYSHLDSLVNVLSSFLTEYTYVFSHLSQDARVASEAAGDGNQNTW